MSLVINFSEQKSIFVSFEDYILNSYNCIETLPKYHVCNHCVIGEKTFQNILIGPDKLPGLSRNGPQISCREDTINQLQINVDYWMEITPVITNK